VILRENHIGDQAKQQLRDAWGGRGGKLVL